MSLLEENENEVVYLRKKLYLCALFCGGGGAKCNSEWIARNIGTPREKRANECLTHKNETIDD